MLLENWWHSEAPPEYSEDGVDRRKNRGEPPPIYTIEIEEDETFRAATSACPIHDRRRPPPTYSDVVDSDDDNDDDSGESFRSNETVDFELQTQRGFFITIFLLILLALPILSFLVYILRFNHRIDYNKYSTVSY